MKRTTTATVKQTDLAYFFLDGELMMVCPINYQKHSGLSLLDRFILGCNDPRNPHKFTIAVYGYQHENLEFIFHTDVENNVCSRLYKSERYISEDFDSYLEQCQAYNVRNLIRKPKCCMHCGRLIDDNFCNHCAETKRETRIKERFNK